MKRTSTRRARFKLHKPISKKMEHKQRKHSRRWWSSAALLLFKRPPSSSSSPNPTARPAYHYGSASAVPLYFADDGCGNDDATAGWACWAPAMRSAHHRAAAELGAADAAVPYVSLRNANFGRGAAAGGPPVPAMPIYLVT